MHTDCFTCCTENQGAGELSHLRPGTDSILHTMPQTRTGQRVFFCLFLRNVCFDNISNQKLCNVA